ncbi:hypothetical protein TSUD_224930 [Trifolium subterraneum]|uniref:Protein kinase domain-containing protein n=1 Tax=Trifolium subterraneum TaxID=3900 RepID=A0A2Z6MLA8_TRISU|nr:hypothetical protein TSUD_224930 [Trifolium subterraneum]
MNWVRGHLLGSGSFATVNLATHTNNSDNFPSITAVKSSDTCYSHLLQNEKQILDRLGSSPYIINCFGDDHTFEDGEDYYNIFLEYAVGGTLFDQLKNYGGKLPETLVRRYTRSILEGLKYVHEKGFVHCDVKLQNILVMEDDNVKISDFGLAKEKSLKNDGKLECRGTPMFISPEAINDNVYESPADIWALGCALVEMFTGKPAWNFSGSNIWSLLIRIGVGEELPLIPDEFSQEGKDFLQKIFVKDPLKRWTADMLLKHPFVWDDKNISLVKELINESSSPSPRTHFNFSKEFEYDFCSPEERLQPLVEDQRFVRLVRI